MVKRSSEIIRKIAESQYDRRNSSEFPEIFNERLDTGKQNPSILPVGCADSFCLGTFEAANIALEPNKVFTADNAGNAAVIRVYDSRSNENVVVARETVAYFIEHIAAHGPDETYVLAIEGHTFCGAINAIMGDFSKQGPALYEHLNLIKENLGEKYNTIMNLVKDDITKNALLAQENVDVQIAQIKKLYPELVEEGKLVLLGSMRDLTGTLYASETPERKGDVFFTNINGITSLDQIKTHEAIKDIRLSKEALDYTVRRLE